MKKEQLSSIANLKNSFIQINMNQLVKDISKEALQISSLDTRPKLTKGQSGLLKILRSCVLQNSPISWDLICKCYYDNVRSTHTNYYMGQYTNLDILEQYRKQTLTWQYWIRPKIRQWFVSTIGILVIKNQLIIIPTIEID